jgi:hypothetical protein
MAGDSNNHKGRLRGNRFHRFNSAIALPIRDKDCYRVTGLQVIAGRASYAASAC